MLIRFEVGNFRSIHRPVELSFAAVDADRPGVREAIPGTPVVPVVGVYGANASGKSNVLGGLVWLQEAVRSSLVHWDDGIPVEPFAFASGMGAPMTCAVDVARNGVRYEYICQVDASRVQYEALYEYPRRKRRLVFEREDNGLAMNRRHSEYAAVKTLMTPRSLALSVLRRFDPLTAVQAVADTFNTMRFADQHAMPLRWWSAPPGAIRLFEGEPSQESLFEGEAGEVRTKRIRHRALALLRKADLGIDEVRVTQSEEDPHRGRQLVLSHRAGSGRFDLPFFQESMGTKQWLSLLVPLLSVLDSGGLLIVDELDASLHPTLTTEVLKLFRSADTNPQGAQLLFSTHDTNLMGHLNRDELWLTEKRSDGSTRLGSVAEFAGARVRESINLERGYLAGRFGGLPDVQPGEFVRALSEGRQS